MNIDCSDSIYPLFVFLSIMSLFNQIKSLSLIAGVAVSGFVCGSLVNIEPVVAFDVTFDNKGFESSVDINNSTGWEGKGDVSVQNDSFQVDPVENDFQAVITTGRNSTVDDPATSAGTFNFSGFDPVTATSDDGADALQDALDLPTGALSIQRSGSADDDFFRTAKEGSAIYQDITVSFTQEDIDNGYNIFELDFNWAYLSNDGVVDPRLGEQDFSFFTVYNVTSPIGDRSIEVLDSSDLATINVPHSNGNDFQDVNTTYYDTNNIYTGYTSDPITTTEPQTYRVGFGVVDVDGSDRTSALLVDNFGVRQVPFEFSPSAGIAFVFGLIGFHHLKRRFKFKH